MKRECPGCAMEVDYVAGYCAICGYELPHRTNRFRLVGVVVVMAFVLPTLWALMRSCGTESIALP